MNPFQHKGKDFEIAYSKYADMLYRLAFSYMTHKEDAEDIVQDVFTKYMCGFHLPMDEEHEKAWFACRIQNPGNWKLYNMGGVIWMKFIVLGRACSGSAQH